MDYNELFLPKTYKENPVLSSETKGTPFFSSNIDKKTVSWQAPVYSLAKRISKTYKPRNIIDIGCGTGYKLYHYLYGMAARIIGIDQESGINIAKNHYSGIEWVATEFEGEYIWNYIKETKPDLIICADVIEHVQDPKKLLTNIKNVMTDDSLFIVSTPDRNILEDSSYHGPPKNQRHVREWTADEMTLLLQNLGFTINEVWHLLPRNYTLSLHELIRLLWRMFTLKALPDRKSCMVFLVTSTST